MVTFTKKSGLYMLIIGFISVMSSGCATRALMSSDRYEKPAESQYQEQSFIYNQTDISLEQYAAYQGK